MPKRNDISTILIIGSGPIVIGQGCEFDYSGVQACQALKDEGYHLILLNSNPATIMTDIFLADATYLEPLIPEVVRRIIEKENIDAILPTMGGQTALNLSMALWRQGILDSYNVKLIGADPFAIQQAEDREKFRNSMAEIGLETPKSYIIENEASILQITKDIKFPVIVRPSFTLGGEGGGIVTSRDQLFEKVSLGLRASPINQVLVEESLVGWKEYEVEVVRDIHDNCIIVCSIENIDPMGIHTGDSITVAPALTLSDKEYQRLRNASIAILRKIGVATGGSNVQFAINPSDGDIRVIEMNPRVSRSSALASKATGFPIAKVAAKLAVGYSLDEITNEITGTTAAFEPSIDYVVCKFPRFDFNKFQGAEEQLSIYMQSVGETLSIGRSFCEAFQKGIRSLEINLFGLDNKFFIKSDDQTVEQSLIERGSLRFLWIAEAFRRGFPFDHIHNFCKYDPWFLQQIKLIVDAENKIKDTNAIFSYYEMLKFKSMGFSDFRIAQISDVDEEVIRTIRTDFGIRPSYRKVDSCAAEFNATTSYLYSSYEINLSTQKNEEAEISEKPRVIIVGSGPNRIGQGIEFDYSCVKASQALKKLGIESIIINCNPETVSTDFNTSTRLYCSPLTEEDVLEIIFHETRGKNFIGIITQLGGQTPLKLVKAFEKNNIPILGTDCDAIDITENRARFRLLCIELGINQPENLIATTREETICAILHIGFPVILRPSYVIGGNDMTIIRSEEDISNINLADNSNTLVEKYLENCKEVEIDAISDGEEIKVLAIMQHFDQLGIHSGDSMCSIRPFSLSDRIMDELNLISIKIAKKLNIKGLFNIQFAISEDEKIYIIEVNPRASRTIPFIEKAKNLPIIEETVNILLKRDAGFDRLQEISDKFFIKKPIFSFDKIPNTSYSLGPQMYSTGEIMTIGNSLEECIAKSELSDPFNMLFREKDWFLINKTGICIETYIQDLESLGFSIKLIEEEDSSISIANKIIVKIKPTSKETFGLVGKKRGKYIYDIMGVEGLKQFIWSIQNHEIFSLSSLQKCFQKG